MTHELPYQKWEREAAEKLRALMDKPMPEESWQFGLDEYFDPWEIFPSLYGSYSSEFDICALSVLRSLLDTDHSQFLQRRTDLAAEMLREMLCNAHLCSYGMSPRVCFPTQRFREMLPELIEKWSQYSEKSWE